MSDLYLNNGITVKRVHFRIDFDWLTGFIRDLWAEGSYEHAYRVLDSSGLPDQRWADLLAGKIRFAQAPGGIEGGEAVAVKDNWQPEPETCHYSVYPDPYKGLMNALSTLIQAKEKEARRLQEFIELENRAANARRSFSITQEVIKEEKETRPIGMSESLMDGLVRQQLDVIKASDAFYDFHKSNGLDPDREFNYLYGFIDQAGQFWGCPYFAHNALLALLGEDSDYQDAPDGWLKISKSIAEKWPVVIKRGAKKPSDQQLETLYAWGAKHKVDMVKAMKYLYTEDD